MKNYSKTLRRKLKLFMTWSLPEHHEEMIKEVRETDWLRGRSEKSSAQRFRRGSYLRWTELKRGVVTWQLLMRTKNDWDDEKSLGDDI